MKPIIINASLELKKKIPTLLKSHGIDSNLFLNYLMVDDIHRDRAIELVDILTRQPKNLIPVQFHYMLNKHGFDIAISALLPALRLENINKYALYKAYLEQSRFYEFDMALVLFNDVKDKFIEIDPDLSFTEEELILMWEDASLI